MVLRAFSCQHPFGFLNQVRPKQPLPNMTEPPSYEEAASTVNQICGDDKSEFNGIKRFSIREEVVASRSHHVAALVSKISPHVRKRAQSGFSRSTLLLLPSDQGVHHFYPLPSPRPFLLINLRHRVRRSASGLCRRRGAIDDPARG